MSQHTGTRTTCKGHGLIPHQEFQMYYLPERSGASDHLVETDETDIDSTEEHCVHLTLSNPENIYESYFNYIMANDGLNKPPNWQEALELYKYLIDIAGTIEEE